METKTTRLLIIVAVSLLSAPVLAQAVTDTEDTSVDANTEILTISSRKNNTWGIQSVEKNLFSKQDCIDNVKVGFRVKLPTEMVETGRTRHILVGTSCSNKDDFTSCTIIDTDTTGSATYLSKIFPLAKLFDNPTCTESATAHLWVASLKSKLEFDNTNGDRIVSAMTLDLNVNGPSTVPEGLALAVGNDNIKVTYKLDSDTSVKGFMAIYWNAADGPMEVAASDTDAETDTTTDTSSTTSCPTGGFAQGDELDATMFSGVEPRLTTSTSRSITIENLANGEAYNVAVVSLDEYGNPSTISEVVCASPAKTTGFGDAIADSVDGGYCFIATAAFGSYNHPTVQVLRAFRDQFLLKLPAGNLLVSSYYSVGPAMARFLNSQSNSWQSGTRSLLQLFSGFALLLMMAGPGWILGLLLLSGVLGLVAGLRLPHSRRS